MILFILYLTSALNLSNISEEAAFNLIIKFYYYKFYY